MKVRRKRQQGSVSKQPKNVQKKEVQEEVTRAESKERVKVPLEINLVHAKKVIHSMTIDSDKMTTNELVDYAIAVFKKKVQNETILGVETGNYDLDYYLSTRGRSLTHLKKQLNLHSFVESSAVGIARFKFLKVIGSGGFSRVYLARSRQNGLFYAIKLLEKKKVIASNKKCILLNERNILSSVQHPFILRLYECFQTHLFYCFVLQYCPGGQLFSAINHHRRFTEQDIRFYVVQVMEAVCYLHNKGIIYRDLKPQNILLDAEGNIKLIDFGISRANVSKQTRCYSFCGSPPYMAPQIVKREGHSYAVDFYCLGALLYEMATGSPPFEGDSEKQVFYDIIYTNVQFPEYISKTLSSLIRKLMAKDPKQRLGFVKGIDEVLEHRFFSGAPITDILRGFSNPPIIPNILKPNNGGDPASVAHLMALYKKLDIQSELDCNVYQKTLKQFEYKNMSSPVLIKQNNYELLLKEPKDGVNYYFDIQQSDIDKKMLKARKRDKSIKKESNQDINQQSKQQLQRYHSEHNLCEEKPRRKRNSSKGSRSKSNKKTRRRKSAKKPKKERQELIQQFSLTNFTSHIYFS